MADIFLSYVREDLDRAKQLVQALESSGWSVWWDRTILPGQSFAKVIEREIGAAKCLIVLWSSVSVDSDWVNDEASEGKRRGILVSVLIGDVRPPFGYRQQQAADLSRWDGSTEHPEFRLLLTGITAHVRPSGRREVRPVEAGGSPEPDLIVEDFVREGEGAKAIQRQRDSAAEPSEKIEGIVNPALRPSPGSSPWRPGAAQEQQLPPQPVPTLLQIVRVRARTYAKAAAVVAAIGLFVILVVDFIGRAPSDGEQASVGELEGGNTASEPSTTSDTKVTGSPATGPDVELVGGAPKASGAARTPDQGARSDTKPAVGSDSPAGGAGRTRFRKDAWLLPNEPVLGFAEVPAGPFTMGSDTSADPDAYDDEILQHEVQLPRYFVSRYEVTVGQFRAFVEDSAFRVDDKRSLAGPDDYPVTWVSWHEALQYCDWLTQKLRTGSGTPEPLRSLVRGGSAQPAWRVTLPSEAEWEKATRGVNARIYPWGSRFESDRANIGGRLLAVGSFPRGASPYGIDDLSGNVWEWTRSLYRAYPYDPFDGRENLKADGPRVVRGGSFNHNVRYVRAAYRNWGGPDFRLDYLGFRVVVSPFSP
jgi:formylglycine-generating enzyme required for sulfatase activity